MAFYIWLDKDGKETKRKPKTRGRPPAGSVPNGDGNAYITEGSARPTKIKLSIPTIDTGTVEKVLVKHRQSKKNSGYTKIEYDSIPNEVEIEKIKCFREKTKLHMTDFLKFCFVDPRDFIVTDKIIILNKIIIIAETGLLNIEFNSAYSRIEVDIENNVTRVWGTCPKNPSFYIQDLFLDFNTD